MTSHVIWAAILLVFLFSLGSSRDVRTVGDVQKNEGNKGFENLYITTLKSLAENQGSLKNSEKKIDVIVNPDVRTMDDIVDTSRYERDADENTRNMVTSIVGVCLLALTITICCWCRRVRKMTVGWIVSNESVQQQPPEIKAVVVMQHSPPPPPSVNMQQFPPQYHHPMVQQAQYPPPQYPPFQYSPVQQQQFQSQIDSPYGAPPY